MNKALILSIIHSIFDSPTFMLCVIKISFVSIYQLRP